ncbi:hypothetical protein ABZS44_02725 [Micromonospora sediminicola]|uniref:hypothetical protein n=1 Tax=Micromonospora sediminicola TaxID=946078 RepID=UPI0033AB405F
MSTSVPERSLANNSGATTFTYVVPTTGDVDLYGADVVGRVDVRAGEEFELAVALGVRGGSPSENVAVRVPLPATVEPTSLDPGDANWTCRLDDAVDDRSIECTRAFWDIGTDEAHLHLKLKANPGTTDGPLTFTATASATTPEASLDNNTATGSVTYVAEGVITGHAWIDTDRDGQRDADEPNAYGKIGKIEFVLEGTQPSWDVPRGYPNDSDGTYFTRLKPGRYVANVYLQDGVPYSFTTPDVGDDATDSDVIGSTGGYYNRGWSAVVEVKDGGETVVDIGLAPTA